MQHALSASNAAPTAEATVGLLNASNPTYTICFSRMTDAQCKWVGEGEGDNNVRKAPLVSFFKSGHTDAVILL